MADQKIAWYSQTEKSTANTTDKVMVYDGTSTYMIPVSAILSLVNTSSSGSSSNWYDALQKASVNDTDLFPVYDGTEAYVVPISEIRGADNLTNDYLLLTGEDGIDYRVKIDVLGNGKVIKD